MLSVLDMLLSILITLSFIQATCPELSPNYAGTLNGLSNGCGNTMGFISPLIVAALVEGNVSFKHLTVNNAS